MTVAPNREQPNEAPNAFPSVSSSTPPSISENRTLLEEPRTSFVAIVNRLLGADRIASITARAANRAVQDAKHVPVPERIDRFEVIRELGRGGFGVVYLAHDATLDRQVAIKVPHPWLTEDAAASARCLKEAQLASKLRHPGIVTIHDISQRDGRIQYVVQEFIDGSTLHDLITRRRFSVRKAVQLVLKIAEALQSAHAQGVYHRDLKPANLIVDHQGGVHVLDFGLAIDDESQSQLRGQIAGTAAYMSPEQLRGDAHHLDGRTDIWSLGVIFYELLTGRRPFRGNSTEAIEQVLGRAPAPPRQFHASIPKRVESCCLNCLIKPVEQRVASASDLIEELRAILAEDLLPDTVEPLNENAPQFEDAVDTKRLAQEATKRQSSPRVLPRRSKRWMGLFMFLVACGLLALFPATYSFFTRAPFNLQTAQSLQIHKPKGSDIDLLSESPVPVVRATLEGSLHSYKDGKLEMRSPGFGSHGGAISLFPHQIKELNYDMEFKLKQEGVWQAGVGILYGVQPSKTAPGGYVGNVVQIYPDPFQKYKTWKMRVFQFLFFDRPGNTIDNSLRPDISLKGEPPEIPTDEMLITLRIRDGQLHSVFFNGKLYGETGLFSPTAVKNALQLADTHQVAFFEMKGQAGVMIASSKTTISRAMLIPK